MYRSKADSEQANSAEYGKSKPHNYVKSNRAKRCLHGFRNREQNSLFVNVSKQAGAGYSCISRTDRHESGAGFCQQAQNGLS